MAIQLQLQDIEDQRSLQSGKWAENNPPDFIVALNDLALQLEKALTLLADVKLAQSIGQAVECDGEAIEEAEAEEVQCSRDRELAFELDEDTSTAPRAMAEVPEYLASEAGTSDGSDIVHQVKTPPSSIYPMSTVAGPSVPYSQSGTSVVKDTPEARVECLVCRDRHPVSKTQYLQCRHIWCKPCLKDFLLRAAKDQSLFPPKCGGQIIDTSTVKKTMTVEELKLYQAAEIVFNNKGKKIYCANTSCAEFIPTSQRTPPHAHCKSCNLETCMRCKALAHEGACLYTEAQRGFDKYAEEEGLQECFDCGHMVARESGCDHMTSNAVAATGRRSYLISEPKKSLIEKL
ncbi:hypothetical protein B0I35DRAFT_463992 [Stachybotrys elegans]|uniref:IBR domain-containing protein n=1 Tax=Stachybotrys elegans TaxID=80388 RepID=A0A8K0SLU8_9HYPO|nr:hypothetical protein B0I35DRAFT_463992 [Stachybotrys elegans]